MKRALLALAVVGVLVVGAAPAQSATPLEAKLARLQRTVAAQQRTVKALQKQVTTLRTQSRTTANCPSSASALPVVCQLALLGAIVAYCDVAITADAFQTTWQVINQVGNKSVMLPSIQPVDDADLCSRQLRVNRQPSLVPPTIAPFTQVLATLQRTAPFPQAPYWLSAPWWAPTVAG